MKCCFLGCKEKVKEGEMCDFHNNMLSSFFELAEHISGREAPMPVFDDVDESEVDHKYFDDLCAAFRAGQVVFVYKHKNPVGAHLIGVGVCETHYRIS